MKIFAAGGVEMGAVVAAATHRRPMFLPITFH